MGENIGKLRPMNPKIETCRQCLVQCKPEERSIEIVSFATNTDPTPTSQEIRGRVSKMSQEASRIGCPSSEIDRIRRETFEQTDPRLVHPWRKMGIIPTDLNPDLNEPRQSYAAYRYRRRKTKGSDFK